MKRDKTQNKTYDIILYRRNYYLKNREKLINYQKDYYARNKQTSKNTKKIEDLKDLAKKEQFTKLFEESKNKLFNIAYAVTHDRETAEDVLQISFLKAWRRFDEYDVSKRFTNWMTSIVKNSSIDSNRTRARHIKTHSVDNNNSDDKHQHLDLIDLNANPEKLLENKELVSEIYAEAKKMPKDIRMVFIPFLNGDSYEDIAQTVNLNMSTVRARVHKAKQIIRNSPQFETFMNF